MKMDVSLQSNYDVG